MAVYSHLAYIAIATSLASQACNTAIITYYQIYFYNELNITSNKYVGVTTAYTLCAVGLICDHGQNLDLIKFHLDLWL